METTLHILPVFKLYMLQVRWLQHCKACRPTPVRKRRKRQRDSIVVQRPCRIADIEKGWLRTPAHWYLQCPGYCFPIGRMKLPDTFQTTVNTTTTSVRSPPGAVSVRNSVRFATEPLHSRDAQWRFCVQKICQNSSDMEDLGGTGCVGFDVRQVHVAG